MTFAVAPWPNPVKLVNPIPLYTWDPLVGVSPIPVFSTLVRLLPDAPVFIGPPTANTFAVWSKLFTVCSNLSPCVNTVWVVDPKLTLTLFEKAMTGFFFFILWRLILELNSKTLDGTFVTNCALLSLNLRSSYWLGVHVLLFCDLNSEPRTGWVEFIPWVIKSLSPILLINAK